MNRRNFFKVVTGFVAGIFVSSTAKSKSVCRPKSGPPGPTEMNMGTSSNYIYICNVSDLNDDTEEKLVCVTPNAKRFIEWVRKEYPQYS